ncbi:MAG: hypothetical protein JWP97_9 [Labilithrix sp.]|nr:hypothetical protein [Labilithrix sp.]
MKRLFSRRLVSLQQSGGAGLLALAAVGVVASAGCSHDRAPAPAAAADAAPRPVVSAAPEVPPPAEPYRARLSFHKADLYVPTWLKTRSGAYDLVIHFHGMGKLQEQNLERTPVNAAVVTLNLGVSTEVYGNAFREPDAFARLVDEARGEIAKSGRAPGARLGRIALSAWSAGFVSIAKIMSDPATADRIDAVLVADGFFTSFSNVKKRTVSTTTLDRFKAFAELAQDNRKLFAITHSSIATVDYASTEETAAKLLEMTGNTKTPSSAIGPKDMPETYAVDHGSFHVHGYRGVTREDHIHQITAMGETMYPYLKARWDAP